jgi:hypothetical protein
VAASASQSDTLDSLGSAHSTVVRSFDVRDIQRVLILLGASRSSGILTIPFHNGSPRGSMRFEHHDQTVHLTAPAS